MVLNINQTPKNSPEAIAESRYRINFKSPYVISLAILLVLFFAQDFVLAMNYFRSGSPIIGLKLYNQRVSGYKQADLAKFIQDQVKLAALPLKLTYEGLVLTIDKSELNPSFNNTQVAAALVKEGRVGNIFNRIWIQDKALLGFDNKKIKSSIDKDLLAKSIMRIASFVNKDPMPPMPDFVNDINQTLPPKDGIMVDANKLAGIIIFNILVPPADPFAIPTLSVISKHTAEELDEIRKETPDLVDGQIQISSADQIFTLTRGDLLSLLTVVERPDPKNTSATKLVLRLDEKKLNKKLGEFAQIVQAITHAEFDYHDARIAIYSQFFSGTRNLIKIPTGSTGNETVLNDEEKKELALAGSIASAQATDEAGSKFVYLTFDDGPNNIYHPLILDILKQYDVKATFFLVGRNSQKFEAITKRTADEGHVIGDHTLTHAFLPKLSASGITKEISSAKEILEPFNGPPPITLFRPPYGGINKNVAKSARSASLKLVLWDVDPRDWSEPGTDELVNRVVSHVKPGSDILLHSNHLSTVKALPKIIEILQSRGYTFKTLQ